MRCGAVRYVHACWRRRREEDVSPPDPSQAQAMGPEETWALISHLTSTLVRELEPERLSEVQRGLAHVASRVTATTDLEMVVPELIQVLGGDGKALRALKMVGEPEPLFSLCICSLHTMYFVVPKRAPQAQRSFIIRETDTCTHQISDL